MSHALLCCSGTFAVELALRGLKVESEDEVILAGYDFPENFRAIEAAVLMPHIERLDPDNNPRRGQTINANKVG